MAKTRAKADRELQAMSVILGALNGLDGESIQRVLDYVLGRLSVNRPISSSRGITLAPTPPTIATAEGPKRQTSIRDLREEKQPESLNQMAALVAYYLSELASPSEFKEEINAADLSKYFKQAGFKLPKSVHQTLHNAASAGYFDSAGSGRYRLNPVGYNLIVHGLPRSTNTAEPGKAKKAKKKKSRR
jgi:hypothetical protein